MPLIVNIIISTVLLVFGNTGLFYAVNSDFLKSWSFEKMATINFSQDLKLSAWVADDAKEREHGLKGVTHLSDTQGMLFSWSQADKRTFWMKNTLLPLDMIFVGSDYKIVDVISQAEPCQVDPCPFYASPQSAQYVIEVNGGWVKKYNVPIGQAVTISY